MVVRFGVELESYGLNGQEIKEALESVGGTFGGIVGYHGTARGGYNDSKNGVFVWTVESDSSICASNLRTATMSRKGTHEIVSPILYGEVGIKHMIKVMKALSRAGAKVNSTCGTHVTFSANNSRWNRMSMAKTIDCQRNINNFVNKYQSVIDMLVSPSRRASGRSHYCNSQPFWGSQDSAPYGRYNNINWNNFRSGNANRTRHSQARDTRLGNRMEFRQHQGTMNGAKLAGWIRLNHKIITQFINDGASAGTNPMGQTRDYAGMCVALGLGPQLRAYMEERMVNFGFGVVA